MNPWLLAGAGTLLVLAFVRADKRRAAIEHWIAVKAAQHRVPVEIALLWAEMESGLDPDAVGDRQWAQNNPELWREVVRDNPRYAGNRWRNDPKVWVSYGLFQVHAAHHLWRVDPDAHPRVLLDPSINADLALPSIREKLQTWGSIEQARLAYVCGRPDSCSPERRQQILDRLRRYT